MAAITTTKQAQSAIIKYYSDELKKKGVDPIKSSRGGPHLRIAYAGDVKKLVDSILPCTLKETDVSISGSYVTQELTISKDIKDSGGKVSAKKGDKIYFILAVSSKGELKTKQLTPDSLGFGGERISKATFLTKTKAGIKSSSAPENIKGFLNELAMESAKATIKFSDKYIGSISDTDLNIIAKDFGELSGAIWFMNQFNKKVDSISYPAESNAALVDYYANVGKTKIAVSAKANEGAPPSINAIADILRDNTYQIVAKESARKAIIAISDNSTVDGIVEAAKNLKHPGYLWLKKNFFKNLDFTAAQCETTLAGYKTHKALLAELEPFYELIGRSGSENIAKRIFDTKAKRWGLIISPLGYSLVDILNKETTYLSVLNDAANSIVVSQIYIKINKAQKTANYTVKEFSSSAFKFEYNANAGQPGLKKISFKMDKTAMK
jgi:hypothetical protein